MTARVLRIVLYVSCESEADGEVVMGLVKAPIDALGASLAQGHRDVIVRGELIELSSEARALDPTAN